MKLGQGADYSIPSELSDMITGYNDGSLSSPNLEFVEIPYASFGNNKIGALLAFPPPWPGGSKFLTRVIDARWTPVSIQSTSNIMKVVTGQLSDWPDQDVCNVSLRTISVTTEGVQYLNPYTQDPNKTVFETLVGNSAMLDPQRRVGSDIV